MYELVINKRASNNEYHLREEGYFQTYMADIGIIILIYNMSIRTY